MQRRKLNQKWQKLGGLTPQGFLDEYWQKKPLLIRNAFPEFKDLLSPDELAGLAMEEKIRARLVLEKGKKPWQVLKGPFTEDQFKTLPKSHWSLLVSRVNEYLDRGAALLETFSFMPHWRLDDLMVSYAPPQGSVGPHVDSYDVFLVQGLGRRRWQIQTKFKPEIIANADLKVLKTFRPEASWDLEPGDMLYLPPGVAHYGVALEDCMTYSIGFRAPSIKNILGDLFNTPTEWLSTSLTAKNDEEILLKDPKRRVTIEPGLIETEATALFAEAVMKQIHSSGFMERFTLRHLTACETPPEIPPPQNTKALEAFYAKLSKPGSYLLRTHLYPLAYMPLSSKILGVGVGGNILEVSAELRSVLKEVTSHLQCPGHQICHLLGQLPKKASSLREEGLQLLLLLKKVGILELIKKPLRDFS